MVSLLGQVKTVYAIDNTPGSSSTLPAFLDHFGEFVTYVPLRENRGIGDAQNIAIELSIKGDYSHVLLLDQDSVPSYGMVDKLLAAEGQLLSKGEKIGGLVPQVIDRRAGKRPCACHYRWFRACKVFRDVTATEPVQTDSFIASGSLIRTSTLQALGPMRGELFIEYVDTEWALRAHTAGYQSYCVPNATMIHSFGNAAGKLFGKDLFLYDTLRYCYRLRNAVYLVRLNSLGWQGRGYIASRIPYYFILYTALSKNCLATSIVLLRAIRDGFLGRLGPVRYATSSLPAEDQDAHASF